MDRESRYFTLSLESLRVIGGWAADCAERALAVYEMSVGSDPRPRAAIEGIREFAAGGRRTARLRSLACEANAAAREAGHPAATAAARAAGHAAASAYTHPLADVHQTKHIVGPAAYAALALELDHGGDPRFSEAEVRRAIDHAPPEVGEVLLEMPAREAGKSRLDTILYELDAGIRSRSLRQDGCVARADRAERRRTHTPLTYKGNRDPRFVTVRRGGALQDSDHRLLAMWAADCAERVLHLFEQARPGDERPRQAVEQARAWARGEITMTEARTSAFAAHGAAREASGAAREAARAAGHAVAVAHMADHELGGAAYAIRAVRAAADPDERDDAGRAECRWQRAQLPDAVRELVLDDQRLRNKKLWSLFEC